MATIAQPVMDSGRRPDILSGTPRAHPIDRWIFVFMAGRFIAIVLAGFIPSSLAKIATAMALPAGIDRILWLPTTLPGSPLGPDFYTLVAILPMFAWDVARNRRVHPAYWVWLAVSLPFAIAVHGLWGTEWWHDAAPRLMGVG